MKYSFQSSERTFKSTEYRFKTVERTFQSFERRIITLSDTCYSNGTRYSKEALSYKYRDKNIKEILEMPVSEAFDFFTDGFSNFGKAWGITWGIIKKLLVPIIIIIVLYIVLIASSVSLIACSSTLFKSYSKSD